MGDKIQSEWLVVSITRECPFCGKQYVDEGVEAMNSIEASSIICGDCGFIGEIPIQ